MGIVLWLSILPNLFLLPQTEVAQYVQLFKKTIADNSKCIPECMSEPAWKTQMLNYISNSKDQEQLLWVKWFALLTLISTAVIGWVLFFIRKPISKWFILVTSVLLILRNLLFSSSVYSSFSKMLLEGNLHHLPWQMVVSAIFYYAVMPFILIVLSIMVSRNSF